MPDIYSFERLTSDRDTAFEDFYRIYAESISYREQKSKTQIAEMVSRADYKFLLLKRHGQTIGFSAPTMDIEAQAQKVYLPTAEFEEPNPQSPGRPRAKPGSFMIVVVARH